MKTTQNSKVLFTAQAAMIAAIYVVLTVIGASFAFGPVQVRLSEALTILPVFTPAAVPGVFLGFLISNVIAGALLPDIIFGSLATLIGAVFTWLLRNNSRYLAVSYTHLFPLSTDFSQSWKYLPAPVEPANYQKFIGWGM